MNLKKSIKQACLDKDVTQKSVSEKLGIDPMTLQVIGRRNSASLDTLKKLANAFDMKLSEFIALGEDK